MTAVKATPRRARGTGSLSIRRDKAGAETWYGRFWAHGRLVKKRIGPRRGPGPRAGDGLSATEAERELQRLIAAAGAAPARSSTIEKLSIEEAGARYVAHLEAIGRKRSTLEDYRSMLRVHLTPFFAGRSLEAITQGDVEAFIAAKRRDGKAPKTIRNWLSLLHAIYAHAERRGWTTANPVRLVDRPRAEDGDVDVRYLDHEEVEALLRAVPDDTLGPTERALYLTAAMTGLRQGELIALRWRDVDWPARRVRVRRAFVRGELGTPKSRRGTRAVPLADRAAGELERHFQASSFQGDDDLVFAHPIVGSYLDRSKVLKRFKAALGRAGVRQVRFHDLRHTFGTRMAAAGVAMRTLQEWMGHRDIQTTMIYADYAPGAGEADLVERAFAAPRGHDRGHELSDTHRPAEVPESL